MKQAAPDYLGRLRRHQRRMEAKMIEIDYYENSGYREFHELAAACRREFERMEPIEAMLLAEVRQEQAEQKLVNP